MIQTGLIQDAHSDLVTDASYDFYGLRLATAGLDQRYVGCACASAFSVALNTCARLVRVTQDKDMGAG
jgi:hypothetical protein